MEWDGEEECTVVEGREIEAQRAMWLNIKRIRKNLKVLGKEMQPRWQTEPNGRVGSGRNECCL